MSGQANSKGLAKRIKLRISNLGLEIEQVAERSGLSAPTVKKYMSGKAVSRPQDNTLKALGSALDCNSHWLWFGKGRPERKISLPPTDINVGWVRLPKDMSESGPLTEAERNLLEIAHSVLQPQTEPLGKYFHETLDKVLEHAYYAAAPLDDDSIDWFRINEKKPLEPDKQRHLEAIVPILRLHYGSLCGVVQNTVINCGAGIASVKIGHKNIAEFVRPLKNSWGDYKKWLFDPKYISHECPIDLHNKNDYTLPNWMEGLPEIEDLSPREARLLAKWALRPQNERIKMLQRPIPRIGLRSGSKVVDFCAAKNRLRPQPCHLWELKSY